MFACDESEVFRDGAGVVLRKPETSCKAMKVGPCFIIRIGNCSRKYCYSDNVAIWIFEIVDFSR